MGKIDKTLASLLTLIIVMSCLTFLTVKPVNAQTTPAPTPYRELPNPSVPEFTLKYMDNSHAVPPTTTTTTDPFTGKQEAVTQEGYYIQNASIQIIIKNQNVRSSYLYFDVRMKGHFSENWDGIAHREATRNSEYTVLNYALEGNNASYATPVNSAPVNFGGTLPISPSGGVADFQVQAQGWDNEPPRDPLDSWRTVLTYSSEWSNILTISIPDGKITISTSPNPTSTATSTPTATTPTTTATPTSIQIAPDTNSDSTEWVTLPSNTFIKIIIVIAVAMSLVMSGLVLALRRHRKTANLKQ